MADELHTLEALKGQLDILLSIYSKLFNKAYRKYLSLEISTFQQKELQDILDELDELKETTDKKRIKRLERHKQRISEMSPMTFYFSLSKTKHREIKRNSINKAHENVYAQTDNLREDGYTEIVNGVPVTVEVDDMDLAVATYIIYSQSRDGMGKDWSKSKYRSTDDYHRQLSRLYDVADRMQGVQIHQVGALGFLLTGTDLQPYKNSFLDQENVCFYLDPSYLDPKAEERNLVVYPYRN